MPTNYDRVKNWFLNSGIIVSDNKNINYGATYSFYDESNAIFSFLYPEITGYSASALSFLYKIEHNDNYLAIAKASSNWLIKLFDEHGGIIQGIDNGINSKRKFNAYSFDTAICANGLLDCYSITKESNLLEYSKKFIDWIFQSLDDDGTLMPFMDLEKKQFLQSDDVWYKQKGCLHIKTVIPILKLYEITNDNLYYEKAKLICDTYKKFQQKDGSFKIHLDSKIVNLHTQCYALEGLFYAYNITKNNDYLTSCKNSLDWCVTKISEDGSIPLWFNFKDKSKAIYPIAQIIRLMILFDKLQNSERYKLSIQQLCQFMISLQANSLDKKIDGGFYEEFYKSLFGWKKRLKLNSWGSLFAIQALYWYENYANVDVQTMIYDIY